jgi:hypothetical protein
MENAKKLTSEQIALLNQPLPKEALKPHPSRKYLTVINAIYVTERLNNVFGVGAWQIKTDFVAMQGKMVVTKTTLDVPDYGIHYECYGGNDNADLGDAYKGSTTDAITKIGSYLGIGAHVWKNNPYPTTEEPRPSQVELKRYIDNCHTVEDFQDLNAMWGAAIKADPMLSQYGNEAYKALKGGAR